MYIVISPAVTLSPQLRRPPPTAGCDTSGVVMRRTADYSSNPSIVTAQSSAVCTLQSALCTHVLHTPYVIRQSSRQEQETDRWDGPAWRRQACGRAATPIPIVPVPLIPRSSPLACTSKSLIPPSPSPPSNSRLPFDQSYPTKYYSCNIAE